MSAPPHPSGGVKKNPAWLEWSPPTYTPFSGMRILEPRYISTWNPLMLLSFADNPNCRYEIRPDPNQKDEDIEEVN